MCNEAFIEKIYYLKKKKILFKKFKKAKSDSIWILKEFSTVQGLMLRSEMVGYVFDCNRDLTAFKNLLLVKKLLNFTSIQSTVSHCLVIKYDKLLFFYHFAI